MTVYLNNLFFYCCFVAVRFHYPANYLGLDFATIFLYAIVESIRLLLGNTYIQVSTMSLSPRRCANLIHTTVSKGNKTIHFGALLAAFLLGLPIIVLHAYYIELQSYV
jgi:NADH:ubiquinone oxidoreductase subunit 4 (subunit M)